MPFIYYVETSNTSGLRDLTRRNLVISEYFRPASNQVVLAKKEYSGRAHHFNSATNLRSAMFEFLSELERERVGHNVFQFRVAMRSNMPQGGLNDDNIFKNIAVDAFKDTLSEARLNKNDYVLSIGTPFDGVTTGNFPLIINDMAKFNGVSVTTRYASISDIVPYTSIVRKDGEYVSDELITSFKNNIKNHPLYTKMMVVPNLTASWATSDFTSLKASTPESVYFRVFALQTSELIRSVLPSRLLEKIDVNESSVEITLIEHDKTYASITVYEQILVTNTDVPVNTFIISGDEVKELCVNLFKINGRDRLTSVTKLSNERYERSMWNARREGLLTWAHAYVSSGSYICPNDNRTIYVGSGNNGSSAGSTPQRMYDLIKTCKKIGMFQDVPLGNRNAVVKREELYGRYYSKLVVDAVSITLNSLKRSVVRADIYKVLKKLIKDDLTLENLDMVRTGEHKWMLKVYPNYFFNSSSNNNNGNLLSPSPRLRDTTPLSQRPDTFMSSINVLFRKGADGIFYLIKNDNESSVMFDKKTEYLNKLNVKEVKIGENTYYVSKNADINKVNDNIKETEKHVKMNSVRETLTLNNYSYRPNVSLIAENNELKHLRNIDSKIIYYGVEMEHATPVASKRDVSINDVIVASSDVLTDGRPLVYTTSDSSVRNGFETKTIPVDYKTLKSLNWNDYFNVLTKSGMDGSHESCGLHIHMSRAGIKARFDEKYTASGVADGERLTFNTKDLTTFVVLASYYLLLLNDNTEKVIKFTRRDVQDLNRYAAIVPPIDKTYLVHLFNGIKLGRDLIDLLTKSLYYYRREKYNAIALHKEDTIEFRMFKGVNNAVDLLNSVDFATALVEKSIDLVVSFMEHYRTNGENVNTAPLVSYKDFDIDTIIDKIKGGN